MKTSFYIKPTENASAPAMLPISFDRFILKNKKGPWDNWCLFLYENHCRAITVPAQCIKCQEWMGLW